MKIFKNNENWTVESRSPTEIKDYSVGYSYVIDKKTGKKKIKDKVVIINGESYIFNSTHKPDLKESLKNRIIKLFCLSFDQELNVYNFTINHSTRIDAEFLKKEPVDAMVTTLESLAIKLPNMCKLAIKELLQEVECTK